MFSNYSSYSRLSALLASAAVAVGAAAPAAAQDASAPVQAAPEQVQAAPEQAAAVPEKFNVEAIEVVGATVLSADEIENVVYNFTGEGKTSADIDAARKALQDAYAARGYEAVVVDVPPQDNVLFANGIVQIRVSEAPVGEVRIAGAKHHSVETLRGQLPAVTEGKPLNLSDLQKQLVQANRIPDRTVTPSFRPGKQEGVIDVDLKVKDSFPVHGSLDVNNDNSPNTHPLRLSASLRYTNLWGAGHTISGAYIVTPEARSENEVFFGAYNAPILGTPWSISVSGYKSNSNVAALGGTQVLGNGYQVGARAIYRLSGEKTDQSFSFGFDFKDFKQNIVIKNAVASQAPIRYIPLVLGYSWSRPSDKDQLDINVGGTFGLRVIKHLSCLDPTVAGCTPEDQFTLKDYSARENFTHVNLDASYTRVIADDISAIFRVAAQYADSHLVSNEQFAVGGEATVRGYYQSESVGDRGFAATLQLDGPSLAGSLPEFVGEFRPFVFADWGVVSLIDPLKDQQSRFGLASVGGGLRTIFFNHLSGGVTVGVPLKSRTDTKRGDARVTFSARGEF